MPDERRWIEVCVTVPIKNGDIDAANEIADSITELARRRGCGWFTEENREAGRG